MDNVGTLHFPVEPHCPCCCPACFASAPFQALWKSLRNHLGQDSDNRFKVPGLKSEPLTGFIPESRPASFRNADRIDPGIVAALPRNPQRS